MFDFQERYDRLQQAASSGDDYGIKRHLQYGVLQVRAQTNTKPTQQLHARKDVNQYIFNVLGTYWGPTDKSFVQ